MKIFDIISEDTELSEGPPKSSEESLKELQIKYPNWDYSKAEIYPFNGRKAIKNIRCKIHDVYFPENGEPLLVSNNIRGTGCKLCSKGRMRDTFLKQPEQIKKDLSKIPKFKNKVDFSKCKVEFDNQKGAIVSNFYCKIHHKYFDGGETNSGIRSFSIKHRDTICPDCISDVRRNGVAKSNQEWREEFKKNKNNKNFDFSKTEVSTLENGFSYAFNVSCNVKGLNGKKHGMFAIEDPNKINEGGLQTYYLKIGKYQCPKCQCEGEQKEFLKNAIARHGDKYLYDKVDFCDPNSIVNGKRKVLIGCKVKGPNGREHGYFFQNPYNHQGRGQGCPICRESKGEIYVNSVLISKYGSKYKILREKDATFEKLVGKKLPLPFDFYIPEKKVLIEYDGEGHFEPTYGSSDARRSETYNNTFQNDNIKNNWIKSKKNNPDGISLIRIPYTMEFKDIDKLLVQRIRNIQPNTIYYLGEYPRRSARKEIISKFKINETKLSLMNTYKEIN